MRTLQIMLAAALALAAPAAGRQPAPAYPMKAPSSPIVIGQSYSVPSTILGDTRTVNVRLPDHYGEAGRQFPVIVLLDGGVDEDFVHIAGLAQINAAYGQGQEVIVIGVAGADRRHDLTSPSAIASDRAAAPTSGGADAYRRFLVEELRPWIGRMFGDQGRVAVMGESLAGLFVLETALKQPRAFDDYIAVSPSLWWNGGHLAHDAPTTLRDGEFSGQRLWIAFDQPAPPKAQAKRERALQDRFVRALDKAAPSGLEWSARRMNEGHAGIYHPAAVKAFRAFYGNPSPPAE